MGPQIHELAIFCIKETPFEFGFCVGNCSKFFKSVDYGPIKFFMKKIANSLFGAPNCRPFGEIGGLPIGPKWTNLKIFQSYIVQNPN